MALQADDKTTVYKRRGAEGTLTLRGSVDIFEAQDMLATVRRALADTKALSFCANLTEVERLDLSSLQILVALRRELEDAGRTMPIKQPEALAATLKQTGFSF